MAAKHSTWVESTGRQLTPYLYLFTSYALFACTEVAPSNPYDPATATASQKKSLISGVVSIPTPFPADTLVIEAAITLTDEEAAKTIAQATPDADGSFVIDSIATGRYTLSFELAGFKDQSRRLEIGIGDDRELDELSMTPVYRSVSFLVGLADTMVAAGVSVTAFLDDRRVARAVSDVMGRVELSLIERSHVLELSYDGYDRQQIRLEWNEDGQEFMIDGNSLADANTFVLARAQSPLFLADLESKVAPKQTISLDIEGGTPPYTVSFKNSPPATGPGAIIVGTQVHLGEVGQTKETVIVIDSNGGTIERTIDVGAALVIDPAAITVAPGTAHRFRAFGGRPPYRFSSPTFTGLTIDPNTGITIAPSQVGARTRVVVEDANGAQAIAVLVTQRITSEAISPMLIESAAVRGHHQREIFAVNGAHNQIQIYESSTMGLLSLVAKIPLPELEVVDGLARIPTRSLSSSVHTMNSQNGTSVDDTWPPIPKPWPREYERPDDELWPEELKPGSTERPHVGGVDDEATDNAPPNEEQMAYISNGVVSTIGVIGRTETGEITELARHPLDDDTGRAIGAAIIEGDTYIAALTLSEIILLRWNGVAFQERARIGHSGDHIDGVGPLFMDRDLTGDGQPDLVYLSQRKTDTDRWSEIHLVPAINTHVRRSCAPKCSVIQSADMPGHLDVKIDRHISHWGMALLPPNAEGWHRGLVVAARYASELWIVKTDEPNRLTAETSEHLPGNGQHCRPCGRAEDDLCSRGLACVNLHNAGEAGARGQPSVCLASCETSFDCPLPLGGCEDGRCVPLLGHCSASKYATWVNPRQVSNLDDDAVDHTVMAVATNTGIQLFDAYSDGGLRLRSGRRLDSPLTFTLTDINRDGHHDLVTTLLDQDGFEVIMSRSSQFQQSEILTAPESMRGFHAVDWTGDGAVELLLEHVEGLSFLRNGESGWQVQQRLRIPNFLTPAHLLELSGDGRLDIVGYQLKDRLKDVFTWQDDLEMFGHTHRTTSGVQPVSVTAIDVDDDGDRDLITANEFSFDVGIHHNDGTGVCTHYGDSTLWSDSGMKQSPYQVEAIHQGEHPEYVLVMTRPVFGSEGTQIARLMSGANQDVVWRTDWSSDDPRGRPSIIEPTDCNGDGYTDLILRFPKPDEGGRQLAVMIGQTDGSGFGPARPISFYAVDGRLDAIELSDISGDGHVDLLALRATANQTIEFFGRGDCSFQYAGILHHTEGASQIETGDVDGDGLNDVIARTPNQELVIYLNEGRPDDPLEDVASNDQICDRCEVDADCGSRADLCAGRLGQWSVCSTDCSQGRACPSGFECTSIKRDGITFQQCLHTGEFCLP